jgi:hypothetical protein
VPEKAKSLTSGHQNAALLMCNQKQYTLSGFWLKVEQAVNQSLFCTSEKHEGPTRYLTRMSF